jgi:hypothetical protein
VEDRRLLLAVAAVLVFVFALASTNVAANHEPTPHDVPVGVVGPPATADRVAASLRRAGPNAYAIRDYPSLGAARDAILHRRVYGAYRPARSPVLLVASGASQSVAALLQQTFPAIARRDGHQLVVRDLVPLPKSDSRGATTFSAVLSLIFAAVAGATLIYMVGRHRPQAFRLAVLVGLGVGAGFVTALVTNVVIGAFTGHFLAVWGVAALYVLALALPIAGFQALLGPGGTAVGAVMFLVIGNPASGGGSAPELLPAGLRQLSQLLPPGAATSALRDVVYFHGHGITGALLVLAAYAVLGAAFALIVSRVRAGAEPPIAAAPGRPAPAARSTRATCAGTNT